MHPTPTGPKSGRPHSRIARPLWRWTCAALLAIPLLVGVDQAAATPAGIVPATLHTARGDLVTGDAATFAQALTGAGRDGQILVWLKDVSTPRPTADFLAHLPGSAPETIALATESPQAPHRHSLGQSSVRRESSDAVAHAVAQVGGIDITPMQALPLLSLRLPERARVAAVRLLLKHPNVDYVSVVRAHAATPLSAPQGSNPVDAKHSVHHIAQAWDLTRGSNAIVGVLDSGFAREAATGAFHDDGRNLGGYGVVPLGFVDDGCSSSDAAYGHCTPYDDYGHGTAVTGVIGENDNDIGYVGIAPQATTYSMKIAWNTYIQGHCDDNVFGNTRYCIEDDDFIQAVNYASYHQFDVLSMSFSSGLGGDAYRALSTAYHTYGVLLVAATGNTPGAAPEEPASFDVVMGIAGVDAAGNNMYSTAARDVSGFTSPATLAATCYQYSYCDAGSPGQLGGVGGTSAATAIVAGIAGLLRSYHPNETPDQIWERLVNSAEGPNKVVNAYAALTYPRPLGVSIFGPPNMADTDYGTWTAQRTGGTGPYSYQWYRDGEPVGTGQFYSSYGGGFTLQVDVTDAVGNIASGVMWVGGAYTPCPGDPQQECVPTQ